MHTPGDERAQSSTIGVALIIGITIAAAVAVVVLGAVALEDSQRDSSVSQAEQAMTQFDSRAAQVALGDSGSKTVNLGRSGGGYSVDEDAGNVRIFHEDWNETESVDDEVIYDWTSLGALVYENDGTEIAYQGGGVWRKDRDGGATMVSSPEFHYRQSTLTFPIVRVTGDGAAAGNPSARVSKLDSRDVFPDRQQHYAEDSDNPRYLNPVSEGNMTVEIQSEYCDAWRRYFLDRTEGSVSECSEDGNVTAQLITLGTVGDFDIAGGSTVEFRGMDSDTLENFEFDFESDSSSGFNNFDWKMATEPDAQEQLEVYIEARDGDGDGNAVHVHIFYSEDGGDTYHSWVLDENDPDAFTLSGEKEDATLAIDLLDSSREFTYTDVSEYSLASGNEAGPVYDGDDGSFIGNETIDESYEEDDRANLDTVTRHYFGIAAEGNLDMNIKERQPGNAEAGLSDESSGNIIYDGGGQVLTFLHITENGVEIRLGS